MEFSDSSLEFSDPLDAAISDLEDDGSYMERLIRLSQTFYYSPAATMRAKALREFHHLQIACGW